MFTPWAAKKLIFTRRTWLPGVGGWREGWISKGHRESLGGDGNVRILTMGVVSQIYTTVKIHQIVDIKWI